MGIVDEIQIETPSCTTFRHRCERHLKMKVAVNGIDAVHGARHLVCCGHEATGRTSFEIVSLGKCVGRRDEYHTKNQQCGALRDRHASLLSKCSRLDARASRNVRNDE